MGSDERIQGLGALKPVSLLRVFVAGRGYLLWPEDLALAGNMQLVEASLVESGTCTPNIVHTLTALNPNSTLLTFRLCWTTDLRFWHAILCNTPQSEAGALALSDLGLSLLKYYEASYSEIGEMLVQMAKAPSAPGTPNWSERFFRLPRQVPSSLNSQMRAMLTDVHKVMPDMIVSAQTHLPSPQRALQWMAISGWLVAGLLLMLLIFVLRA